MTNDEIFGFGHDEEKAMRELDRRDDFGQICSQCGEPCTDLCEACREANEAELRAALHLANTLKFIETSLGLR